MHLPQLCPLCGASIMNYSLRCGECVYGLRVKVFDHRLFKNDVDTPISITMQPARVVNERTDEHGRLLWDVVFDYRPGDVSRGHFADKTQ